MDRGKGETVAQPNFLARLDNTQQQSPALPQKVWETQTVSWKGHLKMSEKFLPCLTDIPIAQKG